MVGNGISEPSTVSLLAEWWWQVAFRGGLGWEKVEVSSLLASLQTGVGGVLLLTSVPW